MRLGKSIGVEGKRSVNVGSVACYFLHYFAFFNRKTTHTSSRLQKYSHKEELKLATVCIYSKFSLPVVILEQELFARRLLLRCSMLNMLASSRNEHII